jgi:hypothetical protein
MPSRSRQGNDYCCEKQCNNCRVYHKLKHKRHSEKDEIGKSTLAKDAGLSYALLMQLENDDH